MVHVVDASHPDPEGQLSAVREVMADVGAHAVPEVVALNKADVADPEVVDRLLRRERNAVAVSARTGEGLDDLLARVAQDLPHPEVEVDLVVPFARGDLISRTHDDGEVLDVEHLAEGTRIHARVDQALAAALTDASTPEEGTRSG